MAVGVLVDGPAVGVIVVVGLAVEGLEVISLTAAVGVIDGEIGVGVVVGLIVIGACVGAIVDGTCVGEVVGFEVGLAEGSRLFVGVAEGIGVTGRCVGFVVSYVEKRNTTNVNI